jgi:sentrin-specific protease 7
LAIICFPGLVGKVSCVAKTNENNVHKTVQKSKKIKEIKAKAVTIGSTTITPVPTTITIDQLDDGSERDEAEGDDDEMEMDSDEEVK